MDLGELKFILDERKQPTFRFKQIINEVYKNFILDFAKMTNLPSELRIVLQQKMKILPFKPEKILFAKDKKTAKALLKLRDNNYIETVLIAGKSSLWTACVSSQVGCPVSCVFCATGSLGFKRNLTGEEISDQVLFWQSFLKDNQQFKVKTKLTGKVTNIVYMGMGEPFLNWENVKQSLYDLTDASLFGIGDRNISVSTVGIPEIIKKFGQAFGQINLAISLHSVDNRKRNKLIPINQRYDVIALRKAIENFLNNYKRKVFIEYIMICDMNDSEEDALALVSFIKSIDNNYLLVCNLIPCSSQNLIFKASSQEKINKFIDILSRNKITVTIRKSLGSEITGACGQLRGKFSTR